MGIRITLVGLFGEARRFSICNIILNRSGGFGVVGVSVQKLTLSVLSLAPQFSWTTCISFCRLVAVVIMVRMAVSSLAWT